jgi:hypothetical protein
MTRSPQVQAAADNGRFGLPPAIALRALLAAVICAGAALCLHASLEIKRWRGVFQVILKDPATRDLSGSLWRHHDLLLVLAALGALGGLACLVFVRGRVTALLVAVLIAAGLFAQWHFVTAKTGDLVLKLMKRSPPK